MNDWKARAEREAAAVIAGWIAEYRFPDSHDELVSLVALAWVQGATFASHLDLAALETGAEALRAGL